MKIVKVRSFYDSSFISIKPPTKNNKTITIEKIITTGIDKIAISFPQSK